MSTITSSVIELAQPSIDFVTNIWNAGVGFVNGSVDAVSSVLLSS
ncbi:hypothetical protein [Corynebacterium maris]|nr:hypothetical protein [Corynebacterium maris]